LASVNLILPLIPLLLGFAAFGRYKKTTTVSAPLVPLRLLANYTAISLYIQSVFTVLFMAWICYFITAYFQDVLEEPAAQAGLELLAFIIPISHFTVLEGILLARFGKAREIHMLGSVIMAIGLRCFSAFDASTSLAVRVILQIVVAAGSGLLMSTVSATLQVQLPESDVAVVTAFYGVRRSFRGCAGE
jgi:hypothetical protein